MLSVLDMGRTCVIHSEHQLFVHKSGHHLGVGILQHQPHAVTGRNIQRTPLKKNLAGILFLFMADPPDTKKKGGFSPAGAALNAHQPPMSHLKGESGENRFLSDGAAQ
eukprot:TRINITY_DN8111_c0_g2_i1.p2 TRINITY_DN8111_c0_g2~~TRINITY_DN8111_c0_g2_i1.p2  ORF type:complete len:108 (+),score=8.86 TRINITY_DN8111_c0_g2_i1:72-395(+)